MAMKAKVNTNKCWTVWVQISMSFGFGFASMQKHPETTLGSFTLAVPEAPSSGINNRSVKLTNHLQYNA
jgi:hypothetical protein